MRINQYWQKIKESGLTASIFVAVVGKPPDVGEVDCKADDGEEKVETLTPGLSVGVHTLGSGSGGRGGTVVVVQWALVREGQCPGLKAWNQIKSNTRINLIDLLSPVLMPVHIYMLQPWSNLNQSLIQYTTFRQMMPAFLFVFV